MGRLITDKREITLGVRTMAIVEELYTRQASIEKLRKGSLEIIVDFSNGTVKVTVREVGEPRKIGT